jgi:hypothetical protein
MYKAKFIYKSTSCPDLSKETLQKPVIRDRLQTDICDSPTTKIESGYGHFIKADEADAPKMVQQVIHMTVFQEICYRILFYIKKVQSFITLGCL